MGTEPEDTQTAEVSAELRSWCFEEGKLPISRGVLPTKKAEDPHTGTGRVTNRPAVL